MKTFVVICLLAITSALAAPTDSAVASSLRERPALQHEEIHDELGQFALRYVTAEGTIVEERGKLVPRADGKDHVLIYEGSYTFVGDDGKTYVTKYKTDFEGAHQPQGDHLPETPEPESKA